MLQKFFFLVILFTALAIVGCNEELVTPQGGDVSIISGGTKLIEVVDPGTVTHLSSGETQVLNQVTIFKDSSSNAKFSGLREVVLNTTILNSNGEENSYGTFSLETDNGEIWEGEWTGHTTSTGSTIEAVGYNIEEEGISCVWNYYFPSSKGGTVGTFTARIIYDRDEL